nr:hypothetical protein [Tanacetum cinerariifolium]
MAKSSSKNKVFDNSLCFKDCKKNTKTLNSKITDLTDKLFDANNMIYHYKLALAQVESRLVEYKEREVKYIEEIRTLEYYNEGLLTASKDLDNLIESQRSDKNKEGLGYTIVPPPIAQHYLSPKKDLSWTDLSECADDTVTDYSRPSPVAESTLNHLQNSSPSASETGASDNIFSKPAVKFVKAAERPTTYKVETAKKPTVRYVELYRKTTKRACFNCGHVDHLSYDCGLGVKKGTTKPQNNTHMSMPPRPAIHRPYRPPMRLRLLSATITLSNKAEDPDLSFQQQGPGTAAIEEPLTTFTYDPA